MKYLLPKWRRWLSIVDNQVIHLKHLQNIFQETQKIIAANPKIHHRSAFYDLLNEGYGTAISVGIRRLDDRDNRSISFLRLLEEIRDHSSLLSRLRYVALYRDTGNKVDTELTKQLANTHFDKLVGSGKRFLPKSHVIRDASLLKKSTRLIRWYVNKQVAHRNIRQLKKLPTYKDLHDALNAIEKLVIRYESLMWAKSYLGGLTPVIQYNWKKIFKEPWIP